MSVFCPAGEVTYNHTDRVDKICPIRFIPVLTFLVHHGVYGKSKTKFYSVCSKNSELGLVMYSPPLFKTSTREKEPF